MIREQQNTEMRATLMANKAVEIEFGAAVEGLSFDDTLPEEVVLAELRRQDVATAGH